MLSKVKDVRQYITRFVMKDKLDYNKIYTLFEKDPEYYSLLKKMLKLKKIDISPSPNNSKRKTKDPKENHNKRKVVNDENQPIIARSSSPRYKKKSSYESPTKCSNPNAKRTITLEENYSQTKIYQKGTIVSGSNNISNKGNDITKAISNKSLASSSNNGSSQKPQEKAVVYNYETNPFQTTNKPTSIKVEQ